MATKDDIAGLDRKAEERHAEHERKAEERHAEHIRIAGLSEQVGTMVTKADLEEGFGRLGSALHTVTLRLTSIPNSISRLLE